MSKTLDFFATGPDLLSLLTKIETDVQLLYAEHRSSESSEIRQYNTAAAIPDLGRTTQDASHKGRRFLIGPKGTNFEIRTIPQYRGGVRYAFDQLANPDTVELTPGGLLNNSTIIAGRFATVGTSPVSRHLMKLIERSVQRWWARVNFAFVGSEAEAMWNHGTRLTLNVRSPAEYDLKKPA